MEVSYRTAKINDLDEIFLNGETAINSVLS